MNIQKNLILKMLKNKLKISKVKLLIFLFIVLICIIYFGYNIQNNQSFDKTKLPTITPTKTTVQELTFTDEQLKGYYSSYENPFVLHIRKSFNNYLAGSNEGIEPLAIKVSKFNDGALSGLDSISKDYFKSKFIVFGINNGIAGGKEMNIIFQDKQDKVFNVWVYKLVGGTYELRGFWQNKNFTDKDMEKIQIQYKKYLEDKVHAL